MGMLFGTDGIRGIAYKELSSDLAKQVGQVLVTVLIRQGISHPKILIGMDTRESSPALCSALTDGIKMAGGLAVSIGVCSTPAVAYHVVKHSYNAGVMISASHNPYEYNGIKIFGSDGFKLSDETENMIEREIITPDSARKEYLEYLLGAFGISLSNLNIGIDCANGSAWATAKELFSSLGAECHMLSDSPNGKNINEKCGSTHIEGLRELVVSKGLDAGIAFDGDADRCIAIDENGRVIDGDYILAILSSELKKEGRLKENTIVGTVMTNLGLRKFCESQGIGFKSAAVGDKFVLEMLTEGGFSLGGEQSGHIILSDIATTGDGQLTAVALLSTLKKSGKKLSTLADIMKKYPQATLNIEADTNDKAAFSEDEIIKGIIRESECEIKDRGKIVVRPSGTEPLIRISAEGSTTEEAEEICSNLAKKIKGRLWELKTPVR